MNDHEESRDRDKLSARSSGARRTMSRRWRLSAVIVEILLVLAIWVTHWVSHDVWVDYGVTVGVGVVASASAWCWSHSANVRVCFPKAPPMVPVSILGMAGFSFWRAHDHDVAAIPLTLLVMALAITGIIAGVVVDVIDSIRPSYAAVHA